MVREIFVLFHQTIKGPWVTFTEYPEIELDTLFAHFQELDFKCDHSVELHKKMFEFTISKNYSNWMHCIRGPIFKKYSTFEERIRHPPIEVPRSTWKLIVQKWMNPKWQVSTYNVLLVYIQRCWLTFIWLSM